MLGLMLAALVDAAATCPGRVGQRGGRLGGGLRELVRETRELLADALGELIRLLDELRLGLGPGTSQLALRLADGLGDLFRGVAGHRTAVRTRNRDAEPEAAGGEHCAGAGLP